MKLKKLLSDYSKVFSFYLVAATTLTLAFSYTGKSINAYSAPFEAGFYTKTENFAPQIITIDTLKENEEALNVLAAEVTSEFESIHADEIAAMQKQMDALLPKGLPCYGTITSEYGERISPTSGKFHTHDGVDIAADTGTPVCATADGTVIEATYSNSYGNLVKVQHKDGYVTFYAHNSQLLVSDGDKVSKGDVVAYSGNTGDSTGPHLHYEIRLNGEPIDPMKN